MLPTDDRLKRFVMRHIAENVQCAACQHSYAPGDIQVVAHREGAWFVKVCCENCGTEGLILVMLETRVEDDLPWSITRSLRGFSSEHSVYETQPAPAAAPDPGPITMREIAQLREYLRAYDGNFSELSG